MGKCVLDENAFKKIRGRQTSALRQYLKGNQSISDLKSEFKQLLQDINSTYSISEEQIKNVSDFIYNTSTRYGITKDVDSFFSEENLYGILYSFKKRLKLNSPLEASTKRITDSEQMRTRLESSDRFLDDIYGVAKEVRRYVKNKTDQNIFDCCFINRGSISLERGMIEDNAQLNRNIRDYQTQLLKNITTYLQYVIRQSPNLKVDDQIKDLIKNPVLYDNNNNYTGILEKIKPFMDTYIGSIEPSQLRVLFNTMNDSTKSRQERREALYRLNAFNSKVILQNFDSYIASVLGKAIKIKDFGTKTGEDKYILSGKTAKLITTWRVSENIDVETESDVITKLAVNTTPLLKWGTNIAVRDQFIKFQDFQHIVAKIKDIVYNPIASNILFDKQFEDNHKNFWNSLSNETQQFLKNKSLRQAINYIRLNPRKYTHSIFELLTNDTFKQLYTRIYKNFTIDELNRLYSISRGLFNGMNSLRELTLDSKGVGYYSNITETVDSIYNVRYLQYYREDGLVQVRTLSDLGLYNIRRGIERTINSRNSSKLIDNWNEYKASLDVRFTNNSKNFPEEITITIPNTNIEAKMMVHSGVVEFNQGNIIQYIDIYKDILPFIDKTLGLNLQNNIQLQEALIETFGTFNSMVDGLFQFAARVTFNKIIYNEYLKGKNIKEINNSLKDIYGNNGPSYDYAQDELGLVHGNDMKPLYNIAMARANMSGLTTSVQVKDSEGNGQGLQTLSRLLGSYQSQFDLLERNSNSASKDFILLNTPGLLENVFTVKEYYDRENRSKSYTKMSAAEMAYSSIVYDYIGGLMENKSVNYTVGNGHVMFLPSVNSDKSTIGRLLINLNAVVNGKPLIKYTNNELKNLISKEFGKFYSNMYSKITQDWSVLDNFIKTALNEDVIQSMPSLSNNFKYGFVSFNMWFDLNKEVLSEYGKTPVDFIKNMTLEYNRYHRLKPLALIDQVHYKNAKGNLGINQTIIAQIARFNPDHEMFKVDPELLKKFPTAIMFWNNKKKELLQSLLDDGFEIDTNSEQKELKYIKDNYPDWINESGKLILAKTKVNGISVNLTSKLDLIKQHVKSLNNIELNPIFETYNYLDYLITQEFMNSTVGSFVAHPDKSKSDDVLEQEASQFQAQHKRNVSFTAAMHAFQLNLLNGIPDHYNIAVVEDVKDVQGTINGKINDDIKPFDGATFVNPFVVELENNSLGGARAGVTKKQFVHFKDAATGTGGIIKTAGFGLTNDWIRNSPFLATMMKKMTNHKWLNKDGSLFSTDITQSYLGQKIKYKDIYFKQKDKYFKVLEINYLKNNEYERVVQELDEFGQIKENQEVIKQKLIIDNNFDLWNFFGGAYSMDMIEGKLQYSNTSVDNVVTAMNLIGTPINKGIIDTQEDLWQPLKQVDVHYVVTAGAIKQGGANINSKSRYSDGLDYDIQRIYMYQSGIQLDKEHNADDEDLSLMTQVISACAAKGYSIEYATKLYEALRRLTEINSKKHFNTISKLFTSQPNAKEELQELVIKSVLKTLTERGTNTSNFAYIIANDLMKQAKAGVNIKYSDVLLPLSDNTINAKIQSAISVYLTRTGIKQEVPGLLSVLTPSYNIFKLYGDRKYESFTDPDKDLAELQEQQVPVYDENDPNTDITNLELGRWYYITENVLDEIEDADGNMVQAPVPITQSKLIRTPQEYKEIKEKVKNGSITRIVENVIKGRDLAAFNVRFNTDKGRFQIWDLDSASALFDLNELKGVDIEGLLNVYKSLFNQEPIITAENYQQYLLIAKIRANRMLQNDLLNMSLSGTDNAKQFRKFVEENSSDPNFYKRLINWVNIKLGRPDGNKLFLGGKEVQLNSENIRNVIGTIYNMLQKTNQVRINGEYHTIDKNSIKKQAYEAIVPKMFATAFGLKQFDDLNTIKNDVDFFLKQYVENQRSKIADDQYTIEFKRTNGDHIYVIDTKSLTNANLHQLDNIITDTIDDKLYRLDADGDIMYEITDDTKIYVDGSGNEVIVSDDIDFYIRTLSYDTVKLSGTLATRQTETLAFRPTFINDIIQSLKKSKNKGAKNYAKYISNKTTNAVDIINNSEMYHDVSNLETNNWIVKMCRAKHTSFLRSLDIIAARIPAQSMQSFMPMKIVAFDNPDINTAFVSTYQILLQGSDYTLLFRVEVPIPSK